MPNVHRKGGLTLEERYQRFREQNPAFYAEIKARAKELAARRIRRYSIKTLIEAMRWEHDTGRLITTMPGERFRINNNYSAFLARDLIAEEPELASIFELRTQRWQQSVIGVS